MISEFRKAWPLEGLLFIVVLVGLFLLLAPIFTLPKDSLGVLFLTIPISLLILFAAVYGMVACATERITIDESSIRYFGVGGRIKVEGALSDIIGVVICGDRYTTTYVIGFPDERQIIVAGFSPNDKAVTDELIRRRPELEPSDYPYGPRRMTGVWDRLQK